MTKKARAVIMLSAITVLAGGISRPASATLSGCYGVNETDVCGGNNICDGDQEMWALQCEIHNGCIPGTVTCLVWDLQCPDGGQGIRCN